MKNSGFEPTCVASNQQHCDLVPACRGEDCNIIIGSG